MGIYSTQAILCQGELIVLYVMVDPSDLYFWDDKFVVWHLKLSQNNLFVYCFICISAVVNAIKY